MKQHGNKDNPLRALALVGALGFEVAVCTIAGYWIGGLLGASSAWKAGGVFVGLAIGILTAILMVKKVLENTDE